MLITRRVKMNARGKNGPIFIKTYSKHMRKVEPWFSPDLKKAAFSFSSSPSSDQSIPEATQTKKRRIRETASRPAKSKGMTAIKENTSDEENCAPTSPFRKKTNVKPVRTTAVRKMQTTKKSKKKIQLMLSNSSENDVESFTMKKVHPKMSADECAGSKKSFDPPHLGRFVTHRKRPPPPIKSKRVSVVLHHTLDSSDDFLPSFSQKKRKKSFYMENSNNHAAIKNRKRTQKRVTLAEVSFNDSDDQQLPSKCPLLSSTPSQVCRQLQNLPEPSISEISSLSFDELHQPIKNNNSAHSLKSVKECDHPPREKTSQQLSNPDISTEKRVEGEERDQGKGCAAEASRGFECMSTPSHLKSLVEDLKERCRTVDAALMLKRVDVSDHLSAQNSRKQEEKIASDCVESSVGAASQNSQSCVTVSSSSSSLSNPSLDISSKSLSTRPLTEDNWSNRSLIDRLKAECLLSSLTVCIPRLDLGAYPLVHQGATKAPCTDTLYIHQPHIQPISHRDIATSPPFKEAGNVIQNSPINHRTPSNAECLSPSFQPPPVSPPAAAIRSKTRPPAVPKERTGAGTSTGRKVCVSGLNVSRWSKRGTGEFNEKRKKKEGRTKPVSGDYSSGCSMLSAGADTYVAETTCGWLQSASGIAVTPLRMDQMNLSSILANFTPDALTTHSWGRLKAALSLHKKKTAFPTPRRLVQSQLKSPGFGFPADTSLDLFASPLCTPSRIAPLRMLQSTTNTPMTSYFEDISDGEKVYQECQQSGPLSFSDCIPPARMQRCIKIGEGTFGEVFSTLNDCNETVALKIIPVEGNRQVNGENQKKFGEILHEIIISKELSSLNIKEINKTDGFIGLKNLHCVRGSYPQALLKAWDKFDNQKGSENDRPDFFDDEQLFLILEFEFGGCDLENMNGKLKSMAQAISILHQVTAAMAVAEQALCFEHRDLHWGNILVKNVKNKHKKFILNRTMHSIQTRGVDVKIIDYSLSRLEIDGLTVSCDISSDEELFMGQGDYQFEIYRLMKRENNNCWSTYNPHSNVLWLHYLTDKLLSMNYKNKAQSNEQRTAKSMLKSFLSEILTYPSATDALMNCKFFQ